jgi:malate dehydrogenase
LKKAGVFDPKKWADHLSDWRRKKLIDRLFGVTHLDIVRASTFVSSVLGKPTEADKYKIPVVGGHSGVTILPLLTQSKPSIVSYQGLVILRQIADGQPSDVLGNKEKRDALINRIQFGGDEVVKAKGKLLNPRKSSW